MIEPYYSDEGIVIYCGDAAEILPEMIGPFDLALTDPPYNAGFDYGDGFDDGRTPAEYATWCRDWFAELDRLAKRIIIFPGHGNMPVWWGVRKPSGFGCWYKPGNPAGGGIVNFCEWEPWLYWGPFLGGSNVIRATVTKQQTTGDHPCPKPLTLFRAIVARTKAASVIDPFMGSGTTLRAAKDVGITAVGIERNEHFCEIAVKRLAQEVLGFDAPTFVKHEQYTMAVGGDDAGAE